MIIIHYVNEFQLVIKVSSMQLCAYNLMSSLKNHMSGIVIASGVKRSEAILYAR